MQQNCLENKIVSLHLQKCSGYCKNSKVCYHKDKIETPSNIIRLDYLRTKLLENNATIYESVCILNELYHKHMLPMWKNYNITISSDIFTNDYRSFTKNIQITIYTFEEAFKYKEYQKLFLVKDKYSVEDAYTFFNTSRNTGKVHLILEQNFLSKNLDLIEVFIKRHQNRYNSNISLDTCLTSYVINGHCPYETNNYIDITYDRTLRKCPYKKEGHLIPSELDLDDYDKLFIQNIDKPDCLYSKLFKGIMNEQINKDSNTQDYLANSGIGSNTKCMRRFSLRR